MTMLYTLFQPVDVKSPKKYCTRFIKIKEFVLKFSETFSQILELFTVSNSDMSEIERLIWIFW